MPRESKVAGLRRVLPATFSDRDLARLARLFRVARFEAGDVLMRQGEDAEAAFLVVDGSVEVTIDGEAVAAAGPGEYVGEMAMLHHAPRSATVIAHGAVNALVVDRERFDKLVSEPAVRATLVAAATRRRRQNQRRDRAAKQALVDAPDADAEDPLRAVLDGLARRRVRRRRRRTLATVAGVMALVLMSGVTVRTLADRFTPVSVDEAVERFHDAVAAQTAALEPQTGIQQAEVAGVSRPSDLAPAAEQAPAPGGVEAGADVGVVESPPVESGTLAPIEPGVYVYATTGYEEVSIFGGSRHTYPEQTTLTVTSNECGYDVRWDALRERWDQWKTCVEGRGIALHDFRSYREFYKQGQSTYFTCTPQTRLFPEHHEPGTSFTGRCEDGESVTELDGTVVGVEQVTVGGQPIDALHVRVDQTLTGTTRGTRVDEGWYALDTGLPLRLKSYTDVDAKATFGATHYTEDFTIELQSLQARR